ncbi:MAG: DUF4274 domain-containing protein [Butyrivibrio sp.]|jgi:hypothetical protein|uniref:DUF4274 domain-containing protein n=1 Tax=Butyrivibrio sp. TaxID=28121 RepID=UPI001EBD7D0A|nr:DUF4274 domain-containing protein [Butyrivibrio sp.]MBE5840486.1 DUF4274 domain-containing protein [Butyrivibrio sp.]
MSINAEEIKEVRRAVYELDKEAVIKYVSELDNPEMLHVYASNYNWGDGFDIPKAIIDNPKCDLSTALMMFFGADGYTYLSGRDENANMSKWNEFVTELYYDIVNGKFLSNGIAFAVPLTKVQKYKLDKVVPPKETVFITDIDGEEMDICI